ncbi:MAG: DUF2877 domain-containing protein [Alphaproteobacteria bacterium]
MRVSNSEKQHRDTATRDHRSAGGPLVVVPILRSGVLARQFCERVVFANVEAVFERCLYLRSGDDFICIGDPEIGNGPMTLIGNLRVLPTLRSLAGQLSFVCDEHITIGDSVRFTFDHSELWRPLGWPKCASPERLIDICAGLISRAATGAPQEGIARYVASRIETPARQQPLTRVARPRITRFEHWLSDLVEGKHTPAAVSREAVQGLIGLGPGLTPSGDDFLVGVLSVLDALGESEPQTAMARAIVDALPGLTTSLSACFLRAAAAGHFGEHLHQAVSSVITGDVDAAIAIAAEIGHSSGWDIMAGILITLRIAAAVKVPQRLTPWAWS